MRIFRRCVQRVQGAGRQVMNLLCPPSCASCGGAIADADEMMCAGCWAKFRGNLQVAGCPTCGHDCGPYAVVADRCWRCRGHRPVVSRVMRVGPYADPIRRLIIGFKFHRQSRLDLFLARHLAAVMSAEAEVGAIDCLVPIPLHWRRRWTRTYNQAELLAESLAGELAGQGRSIAVSRDLVRVRHTRPQTSLARSERLINLRGAFAVRPDAGYEGKCVCLVDDVATTGATLRAAGQVLRQAGAAKVWAAVLAVAAND